MYGKEHVLSVSGEYGVINQIELLGRSYAGVSVLDYHVVDTGDIVYTKSPLKTNPYGIIKANLGPSGIVSTLYAVYKVSPEHSSKYWNAYFCLDDRTNKYLLPLVHKGAKNDMKINNDRVLIDPVSSPSLSEQRKIAEFLEAVDERIAQVTRKKALLEDYKKGCMQQLFSQSIRFKDDQGNDFPDWEEKRLGEVLTIGSGKDYKHLEAGEIPVYGTGGLMTHVDEFLYDGESVCIGRKGTIDKPALVEGKFWTVDTLFYTHSFKNALPRFIYAVFQQINWQVHNEASGVPSLSKSTIERLKITLPHPDEQQKIADFLSAIDTKIDLVAQELEQAKTFKKGLLQQMFV